MTERGKPPACHPDRPYFAKGLCSRCYEQQRRKHDPARKNAHNRKFTRANPDKVREYQRRYAYGLEPAQFDSMVAEQEGRCAVCERVKPLCVDHCHETGHVRALVCKVCNIAIGVAESCPNFASNLLAYVTATQELKWPAP